MFSRFIKINNVFSLITHAYGYLVDPPFSIHSIATLPPLYEKFPQNPILQL